VSDRVDAGMQLEEVAGGNAAGDRISAMTRFESGLLSRFGLPRTLPRRPA